MNHLLQRESHNLGLGSRYGRSGRWVRELGQERTLRDNRSMDHKSGHDAEDTR